MINELLDYWSEGALHFLQLLGEISKAMSYFTAIFVGILSLGVIVLSVICTIILPIILVMKLI